MVKRVSQSASKIADYYLCPLKYMASHVYKIVQFVETPEIIRGKKIHTLLEESVIQNSIDNLRDHMELSNENLDFMSRLLNAKGIKYPEFKFGFDDNWDCIQMENNWDKQPNGEPYVLTGSIDLLIENEEVSTIVDYKAGKPYQDITKPSLTIEEAVNSKSLQLDVYALAEFIRRPECKFIKGIYYFTKTDEVISIIYSRDEHFAVLIDYISATVMEINDNIIKWKGSTKIEEPPCRVTKLCGWCGYRDRCNEYKASI